MNVQEIERRYAELDGQYRNDSLTSEQFNQQLATLMTKDEHGRWWTKRRGSGAWCVFDGTTWNPGNLYPAATPVAPAVVQQPAFVPTAVAVAQPVGAVAVQPVQPQPVAEAVQQPAARGMGAKALIYYALALVPIIGLALWLSFRKSDDSAERAIARVILIITICSFALGIALNAAAA